MNYYDLLGVTENASNMDIKYAYLQLAKKYHPDVNDAKNANYLFVQIKDAYDVLSNPEQREKYNQFIRHRKSSFNQKDYSQAWSEKYKTYEKPNEWEGRYRESNSKYEENFTYNSNSRESNNASDGTNAKNHNSKENDSDYNLSLIYSMVFFTIVLIGLLVGLIPALNNTPY